MDFDYLVPAKSYSRRIPNKNFRKFWNGLSLVDIQLMYLRDAGVDMGNVWLSTDSEPDAMVMQEKYAIRVLPRNVEDASPNMPWGKVILHMMEQMDEVLNSDRPIALFQVVNPLFREHKSFLNFASHYINEVRHDSVVLVKPVQQFLMTRELRPIGWSFGDWMPCSTLLPENYVMPWNACVMTRECIRNFNFPIGRRPVHFVASNSREMVDIDYPADWYMAQYLYARRQMPTETQFNLPPLELK